jgi:hypothetical protein
MVDSCRANHSCATSAAYSQGATCIACSQIGPGFSCVAMHPAQLLEQDSWSSHLAIGRREIPLAIGKRVSDNLLSVTKRRRNVPTGLNAVIRELVRIAVSFLLCSQREIGMPDFRKNI